MKFCSVTVLYNPLDLGDKRVYSNICSYYSHMDCCFVVDNSSENHSFIFSGLSNVVYIPLYENKGIAAALNIGCSEAISSGFTWCMTMDQDSSWDSEELSLYLKQIEEKNNFNNKIVSFAPKTVWPEYRSCIGDLKRKILGKKSNYVSVQEEVFEYKKKVICSGNVINLYTWKDVGGFLEVLFIDEVDYEFCYKLLEHDYRILQINNVIMNHVLGETKKTFFPYVENHNLFRMYYILRNRMIVSFLHPNLYSREESNKSIKKILFSYIKWASLSSKFKIFSIYFKAKKDFKKIIKELNEKND